MMSSPLKENWDEFQWEKEIRKDDKRVNTYLSELPEFIDLPQEDAVIFKRIQKHSELLPADGVWPDITGSFHEDDGDDEDDDGPGIDGGDDSDSSWMNRDGGPIYIQACRLAQALCMLYAEEGETKNAELFVRMICLLGEIMARSTDIIHLEGDTMPGLRLALGKRFLAQSNEILGILDEFDSERTDYTRLKTELAEQIHLLRERTGAMLRKVRARKDSGDNLDDVPF